MEQAKGGRMVCPGCGRADYEIFKGLWILCNNCGRDGRYDRMLFVKVLSQKGRERMRRVQDAKELIKK